ncbi:MAG: BamA/TamA family outer membrane protein, partial [Ginsengibacter sp.]
MKDGMTWYKFLSKNVTVAGSNQRENFRIKKHDKGLELIVYKMKRFDTTGIMYQRIFDPSVTKELRLYGLNGNDKFQIDADADSKIKVRIIGGKGKDSFDVRGNVRNYIYDLPSEENGIINSRKSKIDLSVDPIIDEFKTTNNEYNIYRFPHMSYGFNPEDKLLIGLGVSSKTFGFRKEPFATSQKLSSLFALNHLAYQLKYEGIFNSVFLRKDLVVNAEFVNPTLNNYFGLGNETVYNKDLPISFYRVRYKYVTGEVLVRKRLNEVLDISAGPSYYHYWINYSDNKNRILGKPSMIGTDSASIYATKDYLGGKLKININYVNNPIFPTRGITWYSELSSMFGLNDKSKNITRITSDMTVYASLTEERKLMAVFRLGAGRIFNKDFEYFQALNLGTNNFIRGFRKNRFSGSSLAYSSLEFRVKLFKSKSYILPGDVGLLSFYDVGRVWQHDKVSSKWHHAYGGGIYYTPFDIIIVSATLGISDEDQIFNFSIGTKFNITF